MRNNVILFALCSGSTFAACVPLASDRILGRDLALANPAFASLPPGMTVGYAPAPGMLRVFGAAELGRIARANGVVLPEASEVCFEIPMRVITPEEALDSMRRALPPDAAISIVELPKTNFPAGHIEFLVAGLEPVTRGSRLWHGFVRYGESLRMPVSARVSIVRTGLAVIPGKDLPLNVPVEAASLRLDTVAVPFDGEKIALRLEEVLGRVPKKTLRAGETIPLAALGTSPAIRRGDAVKVEVRSGMARLVFDAVAQNAASAGETVELRNPDNGRTFRARVEEPGRAVIVVPSRGGL